MIEVGIDVKNAKNITNWIQKTPQKILVLFGPILPLFFAPLIFEYDLEKKSRKKGQKSRGQKTGKMGPKSTKIFGGVFWIQFVIFFAFVTSRTYLNQNDQRFCKIY